MWKTAQRLLQMPFLREAAILQTGMWFTTVLQAAVGIITARLLGVEQYGLFALVLTAVTTIGALTNVGQSFSTLTLLAEGYTRQSRAEVDRALAHYMQCCCYWMLPLTIGGGIVTLFFPVSATTQWWIILGLLTLPPAIITDLMSIIFQGTRRIKTLAQMESVFAVADVVFPLAALCISPTVTALLCGRLISAFVRAGIALLFWQRNLQDDPHLPGLAIRRWLFQTPFQREALKLSGWIAADVQVDRIFRQLPYYLLGLAGLPAAVGQFRALMSYIDLSNTLSGSAGRLLGSVLPSLYVKDEKAFEKSFWKANLMNLLLTGSILLVLLAFGNSAFTFIYGPEFAVPPVAFLLLVPLALNGITVGFGTYYRVHRALPLVIWGQAVSAVASLSAWFLFRDTLSPLVDTLLAYAVANLVSKLCHAVNFTIVKRRVARAKA